MTTCLHMHPALHRLLLSQRLAIHCSHRQEEHFQLIRHINKMLEEEQKIFTGRMQINAKQMYFWANEEEQKSDFSRRKFTVVPFKGVLWMHTW